MTPDERYMAAALRLGHRHLGLTGTNPSVATLLVKDDIIIGQGITAKGGWPHAEPVALREAGAAARGATAYVTLEPCAHHGKTPPCVDALIAAGVKRVVMPAIDPNPLTARKGLARLEEAGVSVTQLPLAQQALRDHAGHVMRIVQKRPFVILKLAMTCNGIIGSHAQRLHISGAAALHYAHRLRSTCDAIAVGIGTVLADDPLLTCRLPGLEPRSPRRVIFDRRLRLPFASRLVHTAKQVPVHAFCTAGASAQLQDALAAADVIVSAYDPRTYLDDAMADLSRQGVMRLLVEGGAGLAEALLNSDLVDQVIVAEGAAPYNGQDGVPAFQPRHWERLKLPAYFDKEPVLNMGEDGLHIYWRQRPCLQA